MSELGERSDSWRIPSELLTLSSLMLAFGITLAPQDTALKGCALMSCLRHKQSTFPLIFLTSPLSRIYCRNSSWKKPRVQSFPNVIINRFISIMSESNNDSKAECRWASSHCRKQRVRDKCSSRREWNPADQRFVYETIFEKSKRIFEAVKNVSESCKWCSLTSSTDNHDAILTSMKLTRLSNVCMKAFSFYLMYLPKTSLDDTAHHVRADSTSDQILPSFKTCWKVFDDFVPVTETKICDEHKRNIYTIRKISHLEI